MALCLYLIRQARNQEFFQGRGVFLELGHLNDNSPSTQERKAPQGINHQFFYLDTLKNCILNETLYPQITTIRMFFPKLGHFFLIFEKGRGDLPPSPSLVTHLLGMHCLEDTNPNCPCIYYMVICTYIYIYIYIYILFICIYIIYRQIDRFIQICILYIYTKYRSFAAKYHIIFNLLIHLSTHTQTGGKTLLFPPNFLPAIVVLFKI